MFIESQMYGGQMSAPGQKATSLQTGSTSALPSKADIAPRIRDVSFLPEAEIVLLRKQTMSLSQK